MCLCAATRLSAGNHDEYVLHSASSSSHALSTLVTAVDLNKVHELAAATVPRIPCYFGAEATENVGCSTTTLVRAKDAAEPVELDYADLENGEVT